MILFSAVAIEKVLTENNITIAYNVKYARDPTDASLVSILKGVQNEARSKFSSALLFTFSLLSPCVTVIIPIQYVGHNHLIVLF